MKTVKTKKAKKTTKVKTEAKVKKISFARWLNGKEGKQFLNDCTSTRDVFDAICEEEIGCFGKDGWVTNWVLIGDTDFLFPYVDPGLTAKDAYAKLYAALTEHSEDAAIILTYGTNYSDDRENFAYDCLKAIADEEDAPSFH